MLSSEYTYITIGLLVIIGFFLWKGLKPMISSLDARSERIRSELEEAQQLREEAQKLVAEYKRKQRDAMGEAEEIVRHAREEAARMQESSMRQVEESLERREKLAMEKIAQAEQAALRDVQGQAVDLAIAAAGRLIAENLDSAKAGELTEAAIKELPSKLN